MLEKILIVIDCCVRHLNVAFAKLHKSYELQKYIRCTFAVQPKAQKYRMQIKNIFQVLTSLVQTPASFHIIMMVTEFFKKLIYFSRPQLLHPILFLLESILWINRFGANF